MKLVYRISWDKTLPFTFSLAFMTSTNVFVDLDFVVVIPKINDLHNHFHNILRLFDVLSNFPYTPSETMLDYYL